MRILAQPPRVRTLFVEWLTAGLRAVDPIPALCRAVKRIGPILRVGRIRYDLRAYKRIVVVGGGKASAHMALAIERLLADRLTRGLVVVKYGHAVTTGKVHVLEAGHPVPDRAGWAAAKHIATLVATLTKNDLLVVLLSGGASSLLPSPSHGVTLADKQQTTKLLLGSGATIQEVNTVRKHLSAMKGGRLAEATQAQVISLILSDVIGDNLEAIGSGPTAPDPTSYRDAKQILQEYGLWSKVPPPVRSHLQQGVRGRVPDTPKPGSTLFRRVQNHIIGNNCAAVEAVARAARQSGVSPVILSTSLIGEAREAAKWFGALAREILAYHRPYRPPVCLIAGGELTVTVRGRGRGGRAQEFALAAALEISGLPNVWVAACGTDGNDGPTDVAGAVVDGATVRRAREMGLDPNAVLRRSDSYSFFRRVGGHIATGPTGTNVNDIYLLLILQPDDPSHEVPTR